EPRLSVAGPAVRDRLRQRLRPQGRPGSRGDPGRAGVHGRPDVEGLAQPAGYGRGSLRSGRARHRQDLRQLRMGWMMTRRQAGRSILKAVASALASGILVWSCSDLHIEPLPTIGSDPGDVAIANPSLARDIQPIFTARCAIPGCHITATQANLGLVLTDPVT